MQFKIVYLDLLYKICAMFVSVTQIEESAKRFSALTKEPLRDSVSDFSEDALIEDVPTEILEGNILGTEENLTKRREMLNNIKQEPVNFAFERAIGENDSVYSNFVELIRNVKQKVGRIAIKEGTRNIGYATGFMVSENLMLTNWHVFRTIEEVGESEIQFFYELDMLGNPGTAVSFKLKSDSFYYSNKELDYCFVSVSSLDLTGKVDLNDIGYIFLDPALGKLGNEQEEKLNIIHHPDGDYMQLSIRENLFVKISPTSIWYKTDTAPGSSGSPVFNDQWQVVALHHMGVGRKNEAGDYIDKDGKVIPKINGEIDSSMVVWDANEGIRISVILKDFFTIFQDKPIVNKLQIRPETKLTLDEGKSIIKKPSIPNNLPNSDMETMDSKNVTISFPSSLIEMSGSININIKQGDQKNVDPPQMGVTKINTIEGLDLEEVKKLENASDFSGCKGYQSRFLGSQYKIEFPKPQAELKKFIAKVSGTDSMILNYYNYTTIFHSVRMMPIISGVNIDGDPGKRKDKSERKDVWLRDKRLSFDIQLSDSYYSGSGFDRGHMSRREDANWGSYI